ncbi:Protein PATRONUS 2 [Melia azedarach]|uniref:Protein PATRONUS 2 n=1 Tax=Melia azedarach TaxID=155640 RepID=A0ACC1YDU4_MELAZ|nr:Protein PATRONUS 2 [Melia azedarach]
MMATRVTKGPLIIQNENLDVCNKKAIADGKTKSTKAVTKKGGVGFGSRKALNDITNKSSIHQETSSKKKNLPKEEFNVAEEMFLHDHNKCIEAQQAAKNAFCLDLVLPGHGSVSAAAAEPNSEQAKSDLESPRCYPEPEELPMSEFSDFIDSSTKLASPPCSPVGLDSPLSSAFAWQFEEVNFVLKQDNDV